LAESHHSSAAPTPMSHRNSFEEPGPSPRTAHFDSSVHGHVRQQPSWREFGRNNNEPGATPLPSLSDMFEGGAPGAHPPMENTPYATGFVAANRRRVPDSQPVRPSGRTPLLHHESSSSGSNGSGSTGSLPIHALLSGRGVPSAAPSTYETSPESSIGGSGSPLDQAKPALGHSGVPRGYGFQSGSSAFQNMKTEVSGDGDVVMTMGDTPPRPEASSAKFGGMDALLRAGEIVGRHDRG
jgi:hypothetical protein